MKTFRSLFTKTFVCPSCKRELDKKYLYKWGMCADCVANSQKHDKPEPVITAPEKTQKETFVCVNCKRELNKKYLYKQGMCVDCIINSPNYAKPAPAVFEPKETLKYDRPKPAIPTPEETPKETFVCPNCKRELNKKYLYKRGLCVDCVINPKKYGKPKPASSAPKETSQYSKAEREACLRRLNETSRIESYLKKDNLGSYMINVVQDQYHYGYMSDAAMQHPPVVLRWPFSTSESIRLLDELCSCSKWQQFGIKPKYIGTLKDFLQSDNKICYYTALEYIYYHLLLETNPDANVNLEKLKLLDDAELYKIFKDSIPRNIDYLRMVSYGVAETYDCTLYVIVQKIDKMFRSALEQRKLSVPE